MLIILAAYILLSASFVHADNVLSIYIAFHKNDSVELKQIKVIDGHESVTMPPGEYRFVATGENDSYVIYSESRAINFFIMSDPPMEADKVTVLMRIPYTKDMKNLIIYKGSKLLLSKSLDYLCNSNGTCDTESETYLSCPQDCPLEKKDKLCIPKADGICDPDCAPELDPDCSSKPTSSSENISIDQEKTTTTLPGSPSKKKEDASSYLFLVGAIVIVLVIFIAYRSKHKGRIKKERQDFIKWKAEQEKPKPPGKPSI